MAHQRADAGKTAPERARAGTVGAAAGEEGAQIHGAKRGDIGQLRRMAEMAGEEMQELASVALVGLDRVSGEPPLLFQRRQPFGPRAGEIGRGGHEEFGKGGPGHDRAPVDARQIRRQMLPGG